MSNYSEQESENNFKKDLGNFIAIDDIEVKIKPKNFDDIKDKNASIGYVDKVINKSFEDLNSILVSKLNLLFRSNVKGMMEIQKDLFETRGTSFDNSDRLNKLTKELDNLRSEFEKSKVTDDITDEWEAPASSEIL